MMQKIILTNGLLSLVAGVSLTLTGCSSFYVVSSKYVTNSQEQQPAEITATKAYYENFNKVVTVAVRAPDSCSNKTADQASGGASSQSAVLKTTCGVEMAEIEKALAKANYKVVSWKRVLAYETAQVRPTADVANAADGVNAADVSNAANVSKSLGADVLFQINSLEKSQKILGKDARWERQYFKSDARATILGEQSFADAERNFIKHRFLGPIEQQYNPVSLAVTLDASAIWVESGQAIWYYRWTRASEPSKKGSTNALLLSCPKNIYTCIPKRISNDKTASGVVLAAGESEAISVSEKPEDIESARYAELLKEVISNFVQSYASGNKSN